MLWRKIMSWKGSLRITVGIIFILGMSFNLLKVSAAGKTAMATGSGQITIADDFRNFTFTARTDASGVTTGETEAYNRNQDVRWHGTLDCLSVVGNRATMSGVVT